MSIVVRLGILVLKKSIKCKSTGPFILSVIEKYDYFNSHECSLMSFSPLIFFWAAFVKHETSYIIIFLKSFLRAVSLYNLSYLVLLAKDAGYLPILGTWKK